MSEFYSRVASQGDIPFIIRECEEGARNGHFHKDILNGQYFDMQIRKLLNASEQGDYSGNYIFLCELRMTEELVLSGSAPLSIHKAHRGWSFEQ